MGLTDKRRKRYLALGLLVIAVLLFYVLVVESYVSALHSSKEHVADLEFQMQRDTRLIDKKNYYQSMIEQLSDTYVQDEIFLKSTKSALATAELQQMLKTIANKSEAEVLSSQASGGLKENQTVSIRARIRTNIFGLQKLLYYLETSTPYLFIDEISINRGNRSIFRINKRTESNNQLLDVDMNIYGYINSE